MAEVTVVDVERRQVVLNRGERLDYDSLIMACGGETSYFGHDEWSEVSCALKTLADAVQLRQRIFGAFEEAERAGDPVARQEWLTFVVVGGGPTGVEISGQLAILARQAMKRQFRRVDSRAARVILPPRCSRPGTWPKPPGTDNRALRRHSSISTRGRSRCSGAAGPCARSGATVSQG